MLILICLTLLPPANEVWGKVIFSVECVKNSVHRGRSASVHAGILPPSSKAGHPWQGDTLSIQIPPVQCMLGDTVNKRAVCILLECNLVNDFGGNKSARYNQELVLTELVVKVWVLL